jgi:Rrf2 family nitric oxide-sensitive transcriptional repressor
MPPPTRELRLAAMRLTSFTDYGLSALMRLAGEPGRDLTVASLAAELGVSRHHLTKVVQALAAAGLVVTRRGAGGGFRLARPAWAITLGEVVRHLEGGAALVECFRADGGNCSLMPGCRLKGRLAAAREAFLAELDRTPLAACAAPPPRSATPGQNESAP